MNSSTLMGRLFVDFIVSFSMVVAIFLFKLLVGCAAEGSSKNTPRHKYSSQLWKVGILTLEPLPVRHLHTQHHSDSRSDVLT